MSSFVMLLAAVLLPFAQQNPAASKPSFPKKSGVFAMTPAGALELKISGEPARLELSNTTKVYYAPEAFDAIPVVESVQSFYVNMMNWGPSDLYLVVGRDQLANPSDRHVRLNGRAITRGLVAVQIVADDLASRAFIEQAVRRLSGSGGFDASTEAYVVLELRNSAGLSDRAYPVRLSLAK